MYAARGVGAVRQYSGKTIGLLHDTKINHKINIMMLYINDALFLKHEAETYTSVKISCMAVTKAAI